MHTYTMTIRWAGAHHSRAADVALDAEEAIPMIEELTPRMGVHVSIMRVSQGRWSLMGCGGRVGIDAACLCP